MMVRQFEKILSGIKVFEKVLQNFVKNADSALKSRKNIIEAKSLGIRLNSH